MIFIVYLHAKFQFVEQNNIECPCDFGANLVQHFIGRYSRYSRYQTVFLKLEEISCYFLYTKSSAHAGLFVFRGVNHYPTVYKNSIYF